MVLYAKVSINFNIIIKMYSRISEKHPSDLSLKASIQNLEKGNLFLLILGLVLLILSIQYCSGALLPICLILPMSYILTACIGFLATFTESSFVIDFYTKILKTMIAIHMFILAISLIVLIYDILSPLNCDNVDDVTCALLFTVRIVSLIISLCCIGLSVTVIKIIKVFLENITKLKAEIQYYKSFGIRVDII